MVGYNLLLAVKYLNINYKKHAWVEIDLDALNANIDAIKSRLDGATLIAVVKADGYGHGAIQIAKHLESIGINYFAVSCIREAIELRQNGITTDILILGYTDPDEIELVADNNICQAVYSLEYAILLSNKLQELNKSVNIHLKLNTGMNRLGFNCTNGTPIDELVETLSLPHLNFEGLFTHFAACDRDGDPDGDFTNTQFERFMSAKSALLEKGFIPKICHTCNSAGTLLEVNKHLSAVRTGIILYGLTPDSKLELPCTLSPVLSLKATVSSINTIGKDQGVSYGLTFKAEKDLTTATVTIGYADGYPRFLSNCGEVLIGGNRCKILGRVCMDQLVVDITNIDDVKIGDEVVLIGKSDSEVITADEIAALGKTINYEIVCGISRRVPRYYLKGGKTVFQVDYIVGM